MRPRPWLTVGTQNLPPGRCATSAPFVARLRNTRFANYLSVGSATPLSAPLLSDAPPHRLPNPLLTLTPSSTAPRNLGHRRKWEAEAGLTLQLGHISWV